MNAIIWLILICAAITPFIMIPNDDSTGLVTLTYMVEVDIDNPSSGRQHETRTDILTFTVSRNTMHDVLSTQDYFGYPLAMNVSSWEVDDEVDLGTMTAVITSYVFAYIHPSWKCEVSTDTYVYYQKYTGIFTKLTMTSFDVVDFVSVETYTTVYLEEMKLEIPYPIQEVVLFEGVCLELALILWLAFNRLKKANKIQ